MVVVVPAFAQRQYANDGVIAAVIAAFVWLLAPNMTNAVDAPRHMVFETDADDAAPEQAGQCAHPCACDDTAEYCWNGQSDGDPQWEESVNELQVFIGDQVGHISFQVWLFDIKQPSKV